MWVFWRCKNDLTDKSYLDELYLDHLYIIETSRFQVFSENIISGNNPLPSKLFWLFNEMKKFNDKKKLEKSLKFFDSNGFYGYNIFIELCKKKKINSNILGFNWNESVLKNALQELFLMQDQNLSIIIKS